MPILVDLSGVLQRLAVPVRGQAALHRPPQEVRRLPGLQRRLRRARLQERSEHFRRNIRALRGLLTIKYI